MIKKTWKLCASKEHIELYHNIIDKARELGYIEGENTPPLYIFRKSVRTFGKCSYKIYSESYLSMKKITSDGIAISEGFLSLPVEKATETLVHEVAHFCSACKYGKQGVGHNYYFKEIGNRIGQYFNVRVNTYCTETSSLQEVLQNRKSIDYKYEIYCPVCGCVLGKYKTFCDTVQRPYRYMHRKCNCTRLKSRKIENK